MRSVSTRWTYLAAGSGNGTVRLWNWQQATVERTLQAGSQPIWAVAFAADGQHLAAASHDGKIRIWIWRSHRCSGRRPGRRLFRANPGICPTALHWRWR